MAKPSIWGKKFNRDDDFVAQKKMLVNGVTVLPGQPIDKTKFTTRRLRCLYDWRWIKVSDRVSYDDVSPEMIFRMNEHAKEDYSKGKWATETTPGLIKPKRGRQRKSVAA